METIVKKYNLLISKYQDIEKDITPKKIQAKRAILIQLFALLAACKTDTGKIKNGQKSFKLYCQFRDVQVRIKFMESVESTPIFIEYCTFLKEREIKLVRKIRKLCKKKKLVFPTIENKSKIRESKIYAAANKQLDKFIDSMESQAYIYDIEIEKIRKRFIKLKLMIDVLSYFKNIDDTQFEKINICQNKLDETYDYDFLIKDLIAFNKKHQLVEVLNIDSFDKKLIQLFDEFDNNLDALIAVFKDVIGSQSNQRKENSLFNLRTDQLPFDDQMEVISSKA